MESWDLVVVGAGPAGSTAALAALTHAPGLRVLLLDRARFPRDKCCGDGIAPHVLDVLAPLGAADVVDGWAPLERLDLSLGDRSVGGRLARPVWVIPRTVFDARLVERAVAAGAVLARHRVRRLEATDAGVVLDDRYRAQVVVGADGAHSAVRAAAGSEPHARHALALRAYAPTRPEAAGRQVIRFGDQRQPSYAWAFDRGDGWSNIGYGEFQTGRTPLTRADMVDQLARLLPGAAEGAHSWRGHHLPLSGFGWRGVQPDGRLLLAGDAAGLVNPMTGEGIYYAVATGSIAGAAAAVALTEQDPTSAGARHRTRVQRSLGRHLQHTWTAGRLSRHPAVLRAGIAAAHEQRSFDTLVELGLGDGRLTPPLLRGLARELVRQATDGVRRRQRRGS